MPKICRVLFIGNSYTYYNDMPTAIFERLAASLGHETEVTSITKGGYQLYRHADPADECGARVAAALSGKEPYDFVILQEQSVRPAGENAADFYASVRDLAARIRQTGAKPVLYATWGREPGSPTLEKHGWTSEEMTWRLAAAYEAIGRELQIPVAHVGLAFRDVLHSEVDIGLYNPDQSHPSYAGSYLAAATLLGRLLNVDPTAATFTGELTADEAALLREAAKRALFETPAIPDAYTIKEAEKAMKGITSAVITKNGAQRLTVNGHEIDTVAYITYLPERNCYRDFAEAGYKLFSTCVFFGTNTLNSTSGLEVFSKGIFDGEEPDFSHFDRDVRNILAVCPDAMIFPRVNVGLSREWEMAHPEELNDQGPTTLPDIRRVCFASDLWAAEVERLLGLFVAHIEAADYCDHIIGYQIAGGNTEEWFSYDQRGGIGKRSREGFARQVAEGRKNSEYEYFRYLSEITAARICQFAARIKALTDRRLVVGTFYGYTLEKCYRCFTHNDLRQVLECPDIDFICSPVSYAKTREPGRNHSYMLALHSLKLHGKLYFSENDTRTHLSRAYSDLPRYQSPLWFGPDRETTLEILKMHFARALVHGHASWWFDMWGGWFADPAYMDFMRRAREISVAARELPAESRAEVALLFDERAVAHFADDDPTTQRVLYDIREALGKTGVPYDLYLTSDFDQIRHRYRAFVLLEPCETPDSRRIRQTELPIFTVTAENADVTPATLRDFYRRAGVWVYSQQDAVIYASESHLFLHTVQDGEQRIALPPKTRWIDLFSGEEFSPVFSSPAGRSYLLQRI